MRICRTDQQQRIRILHCSQRVEISNAPRLESEPITDSAFVSQFFQRMRVATVRLSRGPNEIERQADTRVGFSDFTDRAKQRPHTWQHPFRNCAQIRQGEIARLLSEQALANTCCNTLVIRLGADWNNLNQL